MPGASSTEAVGAKGPERNGGETEQISCLRAGHFARWVWDQAGTAEPHRTPPGAKGTQKPQKSLLLFSPIPGLWTCGARSCFVDMRAGGRVCLEAHEQPLALPRGTLRAPLPKLSPDAAEHPCLELRPHAAQGPSPPGSAPGEPLCPPCQVPVCEFCEFSL